MKHEILYRPSYAVLKARLGEGETLVGEGGAMLSMSANMSIKTKRAGSFLGAIARRIFGGESFFVNRYTPQGGEGEVLLAPALAGDIAHHALGGQGLFVQGGSFLASGPGIEMKPRFSGLRGLFSGEGLFLLECRGSGDLWINGYGGIEPMAVDGTAIVDTGHVVAFEPGLQWRVRAVGGVKSTLFSGEGLVIEFTGRGKLWIQTRNVSGLVGWLRPLLPA
jgi:uncharacterized protein (TIGR00266 family)